MAWFSARSFFLLAFCIFLVSLSHYFGFIQMSSSMAYRELSTAPLDLSHKIDAAPHENSGIIKEALSSRDLVTKVVCHHEIDNRDVCYYENVCYDGLRVREKKNQPWQNCLQSDPPPLFAKRSKVFVFFSDLWSPPPESSWSS